MKIAIIEDERNWQEKITQMVQEEFFDYDLVLKCYSSAEELLELGEKYEIVLMDIELPGADGLTGAGLYKAQNPESLVIMITSHEEFITEGYKVEAFRYIYI